MARIELKDGDDRIYCASVGTVNGARVFFDILSGPADLTPRDALTVGKALISEARKWLPEESAD